MFFLAFDSGKKKSVNQDNKKRRVAERREREGKAEKEQKLRIKRKGESRVGRV